MGSSGHSPSRPSPAHRLTPMVGRDPTDAHRAATPLELLYDLVFVISFGVAANEFAHLVAEGYVSDALKGFTFAMFAVLLAWINFSWFASGFDTDDWLYRLAVMVQMVGVVILSLGLSDMYDSIHDGGPFETRTLILGYVVMRVPLIALWIRVAISDPAHRRSATLYASLLAISQVLWSLSGLLRVSYWQYLAIIAPLMLLEFASPMIAEMRGEGTPWHPHHIAERYGLLAIIALGEVLIGTVAALRSLIELDGWTFDAAALAILGVSLTFGLWWTYFNLPSGDLLANNPHQGFVWGYGHIVVYGSIAAVGAGLHVVALYLEHHAEISRTGAIGSVAIPVGVYSVALTVLSTYLWSARRWVWIVLAIVVGLLTISVLLTSSGVSLPVVLLVLTASVWVGVATQEFFGSRMHPQNELPSQG